ncbi:MAG: hypothetical protein ACRD0U_02805 [Acidimicrobiales bacterium]
MSEVLPGLPIGPPEDRQTRPQPPVTLLLAAMIVALQVAVEVIYVVGREELTIVARTSLTAVVVAQLVVAWGVVRLRAGAALCLFVAEIATGLAVIANTELGPVVRGVLGAATVLVMVLLAASLRAFPSHAIPIRP